MASLDYNIIETQTIPKIQETLDRLSPEELSYLDYTRTYESVRTSINAFNDTLNNSYATNPDIPEEKLLKWNMFLQSKSELEERFRKLPQPEALKTPKWVEIGGISPRSGFEDIPLTHEENTSMKVERFIAESAECEYYIVTLGGKKKILRINTKSPDDELALVDLTVDMEDPISIQRFIVNSEESGKFQDIEMQDSKSVSNTETLVWAGVGAAAWAGIIAGWVLGAKVGVLWGAPGIATGATIGAVGWWAVMAFTDRDYTTQDAINDGLRARMDQVKTYALK